MEALLRTGGNVTEAAHLLECARSTLYRWLHRWGLIDPSQDSETERDVSPERNVPSVRGVRGVASVPLAHLSRDSETSRGVSENAVAKEFSLTQARSGSRLPSDEMSSAPTHVTQDRLPSGKTLSLFDELLTKVLGADRDHSLEQAVIDLSYLLRQQLTKVHVLRLLIDSKLSDVLRETMESHDRETKPKAGRDHK